MEKTYQAEEPGNKPKCYVLAEFPYPSGSGLHIGHTFTFTGADVMARYRRMKGFNVLFPIGWDAFGLPTENYAIRTGRKPQDVTRENTDNYRRQMNRLGLSFDWTREVNTSSPDFYRWTQWIFIQLFKHGLTEKQEMPINWCPSCKVGLANEEVIDGRCERCTTETERRRISQWVVRITAYAERLINGLDQTDFIPKVKAAQVNWIGRSQGARIRFPIVGRQDVLEVFTTRPDTLWGATFMVVAPEHPLVESVLDQPGVADYVRKAAKKSEMERSELNREKDGVFTGLYARNPATSENIPIWVSDFVLLSYGSGAIMSVPAHDQRDWEFARKFDLPVVEVMHPADGWDYSQAAYAGQVGVMVNSGDLNGTPAESAVPAAIEWLVQRGLGEAARSYHLRDWIFSRQHYWGEPIPMIFCENCGWLPVPEDQLPVLLPDVERYQPTDSGESPLANVQEWVNTTCPGCSGPARRETDTMPNWAGSDWYFLRYTDPHNQESLADLDKLRYWLPVDVYIGGDEHNTLHLLYSRFIYQFLHDIGAVPAEHPEPIQRRISHGVILGTDGTRMSKSRGNVVVPDQLIDRVGADAVRTYLLFIGPYDATMAWNERALMGVKRFLDRFEQFIRRKSNVHSKTGDRARASLHRLTRDVDADIEAMKFNTAIAKMMETLNELEHDDAAVNNADLRRMAQLIAPFAPFCADTCWQLAGGEGSVHATRFPTADPALLAVQQVSIPVQVNGKLRGVIEVEPDAEEALVVEMAMKLDGVIRAVGDRQPKKVVYVPGRTLNFVV